MLGEVRGVGSVLKSTLGMGPSPPDPKSFLPLLTFLNFTWKGGGVSGIHVGIPSGNAGSAQSLEGVTHPKKLRHNRSLPDPNPRKGPGASRGLKDGGSGDLRGHPGGVTGRFLEQRTVLAVAEPSSRLKWRWMSQQPPASAARGPGCHRHLSPLLRQLLRAGRRAGDQLLQLAPVWRPSVLPAAGR